MQDYQTKEPVVERSFAPVKVNEIIERVETLRKFSIPPKIYEWDKFIVTGKKHPFNAKNIGELAIIEAVKWLSFRRFNGNVPFLILDTILSSNTNYEIAIRILRKFFVKFGYISLRNFIKVTPHQLLALGSTESKWKIAKEVAESVLKTVGENSIAIKKWANDLCVTHNILTDIYGVGIALSQYLRMQFGVDTVKPDRRIKYCLKEFLRCRVVTDVKAVEVCHEIAQVSGVRPIELNMLLWYGYPSIIKTHSTNPQSY